jgi:integrase
MPAHRPYIPSLELRNVRDVFVTEDEFRKILQHLSDDIAPVATFFYWTGWRTSEVQALTWDQVDFDDGVIRLDVGTTKNDDGRELPFHTLPELEAVLRRQRARADKVEQAFGHPVPWVFFWSVKHAKQPAGRPIKNFLDGWQPPAERLASLIGACRTTSAGLRCAAMSGPAFLAR